MKTITPQERKVIIDLAGEGLPPLPAGVLEKDLLVTEVLRNLAAMETPELQLVFCGGTCLAKAYGLIERMSEDVDFKVVVPASVSRSARGKKMRELKYSIAEYLAVKGFGVPQEEIVARNENSYISFNLHYQSSFPPVTSLRSEIKVELSARRLMLPVCLLPVCSIVDQLLGVTDTKFEVGCIDVRETLAEKVLSFLRRTAAMEAGRDKTDYDDRLVRHLYDVLKIVRSYSDWRMAMAELYFADMVRMDAQQFRNQHPEFDRDPIGVMRGVLVMLHSRSTFAQNYNKFLDELVFGELVQFEEARRVFEQVAEHLLDSIRDEFRVE